MSQPVLQTADLTCPNAGLEPSRPLGDAASAYDDVQVRDSFSVEVSPGVREANLIVEGIHCGGCIAAIESGLRGLSGVREAELNFATRRARVRWDTADSTLGGIVRQIEALGYSARPYDPERQERALALERRRSLRRIGVAGVLGMQVMMIGIALHAGGWSGMEDGFERVFRWVSLGLTLPVLLYSGSVFYAGALRDLRNRSAGMDVPVALGLTLAFAGSVHATATGGEYVYYDSVVMFIFFLLAARYLELVARTRNARSAEALTAPAPVLATRIVTGAAGSDAHESVLATRLEPGDRILVKPGEAAPADATVISGHSTVDEALLSGESKPVPKSPGSSVLAGSTNFESSLVARVERVGTDTMLSRIDAMAARARAAKPAIARLADRVAGWFVAAVLVIAAAVALAYGVYDPQRWLPVTISVLVVTCPCALSLATPVATTAALSALARRGIVVLSPDALETLGRVTRFAFDKTGTLTRGEFSVRDVRATGAVTARRCLQIAAALEAHASHPIADAICAAAEAARDDAPGSDAAPAGLAGDVRYLPGGGLVGVVDGEEYALGSSAFVAGYFRGCDENRPEPEGTVTIVVLAGAAGALAEFHLADELREDAGGAIDALRAQGQSITVLSGDAPGPVSEAAARLGVDDARSRLSPADKQAAIAGLRRGGHLAAMVGDGINDAPVLACADVSIAVGRASEAAQSSADVVLLRDSLDAVPQAAALARKTLDVIRQNLAWAVVYNLLALPAAIAGLVPPWLAAIGMSASSLIVVANSSRLASKRASGDGP